MRTRLRLLVGVLTAAMAVLAVNWVGGVVAVAAEPSPITVGDSPYGVAFSPDGSRAYVTNLGDNTVSVIDTATGAVVGSPVAVGSHPVEVAFSPDGSRAYVTNEIDGTVSVIDTVTQTVVGAPIAVGTIPFGVAVSPDGSRVYVTNSGISAGTVSVIDTATEAVVVMTTLAAGSEPSTVALSPDGSRLYVADGGDNTVSVIDTATGTVVGSPIGVGTTPFGVAVSPDGSRLYVTNSAAGTVSVIDTATDAVVGGPITVGSGPRGVAVSPDGSRVYVANTFSGTVSVIDTSTDAVVGGPRTVGGFPVGLAFSPDGSRVYVADSGDGTVSVITVASAPGSPTDVTAAGGNGQAVVSWTAPDSDGGSAIESYTVTSSPDGRTASCASSPCAVTGLRNGTSYTFTVVATNEVGDSPASAASPAVTPMAPATADQPSDPTQSGQSSTGWYRDPLSKVERHHLAPAHPGRTGGKVALTKAAFRSHNGSILVPLGKAHGHQLGKGQGVQLTGLFRFDSATLTKAGRHQLVKLAKSMRDVKAFTCEGYADYAGSATHEQRLSQQRAQAVCVVLTLELGKPLHAKVVGYGPTRPVVIGGSARSRTDNRRVDVLVRR